MQPLLSISGMAIYGDVVSAAPLCILVVVGLLFHCVAAALDRAG